MTSISKVFAPYDNAIIAGTIVMVLITILRFHSFALNRVNPSKITCPHNVATTEDAIPEAKRATPKITLDDPPSNGVRVWYAASMDSMTMFF